MSQVTGISTRNESSDLLLGENSQNALEVSTSDTMETSTRKESPDLLLGETLREIQINERSRTKYKGLEYS